MTEQTALTYLAAIKRLLDGEISMAKDKDGYFYFWDGVEATYTRYKTLEEAVEAALLRLTQNRGRTSKNHE